MLGKRKKQFSMPPHKKQPYIRSTQRSIPGVSKQFGSGYNPKAISYRKPPPNSEVKWNDAFITNDTWVTNVTGLPPHKAFDNLLLIAHGDNGYNRQGNKIMVTKINFRFTSGVQGASNGTFEDTTPGDVWFRWFLIIDTQSNGAVPAMTDVFEELPDGVQFDVYNSLREAGRFKVLMDKFVKVPQAHPMFNSVSHNTHTATRHSHCKKTFNVNLPIQYSDGNANMTSIRNNNIFVVVFCGHTGGANCWATYRARVRFTDY